ncbi:MAG: hypothetical protein ACTTJ8_06365 [Treponema sp.]
MIKKHKSGNMFFCSALHVGKYSLLMISLLLFAGMLYAEEDAAVLPDAPFPIERYQITAVQYAIKGLTREYPLSRAVPIDTARIFELEDKLQQYITELEQRFKNIRSIESAVITVDYGVPTTDGLIPVTLTVTVVDTWNFIAVPYPSFDSNTGLQLKLKLQDFNFLGTLQPLKADIVYQSTETDKQVFSSTLNFSLPFRAGIFDMAWGSSFGLTYVYQELPKITLSSGLEAAYRVNKHFSLRFGMVPELIINDRSSSNTADAVSTKLPSQPVDPTGTTSSPNTATDAVPALSQRTPDEEMDDTKSKTVDKQEPAVLGYVYPHDRYYFKTSFYMRTPVNITQLKHFGSLIWTPSMSIAGNWAFDGIQAENLKVWTFGWGHTLSFGKVNWIGNFRKGLSVLFDNTYSYRFYKAKKMAIGFAASTAGYYPFFDRFGVYGRAQLFYHLFNVETLQAGAALRGILNKRLSTDTGIAFNIDLPIRIASFDFQEITGVSWVRFFNCDVHLVPFLDIALVHDTKTGRYYHPADGWYAGGMEVIVYPQKMRSIYVRASLGFDLAELKNVPGFNKIGGRAKRDGEPISEIFIGIGVHY